MGPASQAAPVANGSAPAIVDTVSLPGAQPLAVGVYEAGNKIYVADDNSGNLLVLDGTTREVLTTILVGAAVFDIAVDESMGKVYTASSDDLVTTGIGDGNGLVSVIDAGTDSIVAQIDPAGPDDPGRAKFFTFGHDEAQDRLYLTFYRPFGGANIGVIGADNTFTTIGGEVAALGVSGIEVNSSTNTAYIAYNTGNDLEPLTFNPATNRLFSGVQVGQHGAVVDGATDALTCVDLGGSGMGAGDVRQSTDNAYFASSDETFVVNGSTLRHRKFSAAPTSGGLFASSVTIDQARGLVYVVNNDQDGIITVIHDSEIPAPTLSVNDLTIAERDAGSRAATLTVRLSEKTGRAVTFRYETTSGTATPDADYRTVAGTGTIPAESLTTSVAIPVLGDSVDEAGQTFFLDLTDPVNATIADGRGVVTITDDDPPAGVSIRNASTIEGDSGRHKMFFRVVLNAPSEKPVAVKFRTFNGTAKAPSDYTGRSGTVRFAKGITAKRVYVYVKGDRRNEPREHFVVKLQGPVNASIADRSGRGLIRDDD